MRTINQDHPTLVVARVIKDHAHPLGTRTVSKNHQNVFPASYLQLETPLRVRYAPSEANGCESLA